MSLIPRYHAPGTSRYIRDRQIRYFLERVTWLLEESPSWEETRREKEWGNQIEPFQLLFPERMILLLRYEPCLKPADKRGSPLCLWGMPPKQLLAPLVLENRKPKRRRGQLRSPGALCSHGDLLYICAWPAAQPVKRRKGFSCISGNSHKVTPRRERGLDPLLQKSFIFCQPRATRDCREGKMNGARPPGELLQEAAQDIVSQHT